MTFSATVKDKPVDLPKNFNLQLQVHSPLYDDNIRIGDFQMNVSLPMTPNNMTVFGFLESVEIAEKEVLFEDFKIFQDGELLVIGVLSIVETQIKKQVGSYVCDFFTNLLAENINDLQLSDALNKVVILGGNAQAIATLAQTLNGNTPSPDGITGTTVKFFPTLATEFYGDENKDWMPDFSNYDPDRTYETGEVVLFRYLESQEGLLYASPHAAPLMYFEAKDDVAITESPAAEPTKWKPIFPGIMNLPKNVGSFYINDSYNEETNTINRHAFLPYIQIHDIVRNLAEGIGYKAVGEFMDDTEEHKAFFQSNLALDKDSGHPNHIHVGNTNINPSPWAVTDVSLPNDTGVYQDDGDHWNGTEYTVPETGRYLLELFMQYTTIGGGNPNIVITIRRNGSVIGFTPTFGVFVSDNTDGQKNQLEYFDLVAGDTIKLTGTISGTGAGVGTLTIDRLDFKITNVETDFVNIFDGNVRYADHAPAMSVGEFLMALRQWKNLRIIFNPLNKELSLDYADSTYLEQSDEPIDELITSDLNSELRAEKRFRFNYPSTNNFEILGGFEEMPAVDKARDLPPPNSANKYILVRNENAYYFTKEYDFLDGGSLYWEFGGYAWNTFEANDKGEIQQISPAITPLPLRRFYANTGEYLAPVLDEEGRSSMFNPSGERGSLLVCYDVGATFYNNTLGIGYRFCNSVPLDPEGLSAAIPSMLWSENYQKVYRHTIPSLIREEIYKFTIDLSPPFSLEDFFNQAVRYHANPLLPIRYSRNLGKSELYYAEFRKLVTADVPTKSIALETGKSKSGGLTKSNSGSGLGGSKTGSGSKSITEDWFGLIETPTDSSFFLKPVTKYAGTIVNVAVICDSGTCDFEVFINGTPLGDGPNSVTSTLSEVAHGSDNAFAVNQDISVEIRNNSGCSNLAFTITSTRTI